MWYKIFLGNYGPKKSGFLQKAGLLWTTNLQITGSDHPECIVKKDCNRPLSTIDAAVNTRNRHYIGYTVEYRWLAISR
jgi:hypothetical protein